MLIESATSKHSKQSLSDKSFIITEPRHETELLKREYQRQFKKPLSVLCEIGSWDAIGHMVQNDLGVGLVPELALKNFPKGAFKVLKTPWLNSEYQVYAHHLKMPSPNRVLHYLIKKLI